jgi:5-(carboxyamino)imidazole ribonucleotide synthase
MTAPASPTRGAVAAGSMLGVLGGGQLGRMFVHAAQSHGFRVTVLEPDAHSPAAGCADVHLLAQYDDAAALAALQSGCAAVTTEFENVPAAVLQQLAQAGCRVAPAADAVRVCQHMLIASADDLIDPVASALLPGILKTASLGYDGKGQFNVHSLAELQSAWKSTGQAPCVLEQRLALLHEISVVVARSADGQCVHLPVQQNLHRDGILAVTQVPAPDVPQALCAQAVAQAQALAAALQYVGVLCVEFFVLADGSLVANEMAPRPHNSAHHSIDSCDTSQFDLQLRTLVGWPLAMPRQHSAAVMLNLMGDLWFSGPGDVTAQRDPDWPGVLALPGAHLHLYGKSTARRGRKMGHLTFTAPDIAAARGVAQRAAALLGLPPF